LGRVSEQTIEKLNAFIDSLPVEARKKCALCNETLTHIVKQAEAQTGAGTRTVCRVLAEKHNEGAAPLDVVGDKQLQDRVRRHDGSDAIVSNQDNNQPQPKRREQPEEKKERKVEFAMLYARMAVCQLESIQDSHPDKKEAFDYVTEWINNNR